MDKCKGNLDKCTTWIGPTHIRIGPILIGIGPIHVRIGPIHWAFNKQTCHCDTRFQKMLGARATTPAVGMAGVRLFSPTKSKLLWLVEKSITPKFRAQKHRPLHWALGRNDKMHSTALVAQFWALGRPNTFCVVTSGLNAEPTCVVLVPTMLADTHRNCWVFILCRVVCTNRNNAPTLDEATIEGRQSFVFPAFSLLALSTSTTSLGCLIRPWSCDANRKRLHCYSSAWCPCG